MKPLKSIQQLFEDGLTVMASRFWTFFGCFIDTFGSALSFNFWTANKNVGLTLMMWLGLLSQLETAGVCVCVCVGFRSLNMSQSYRSEWLLKNMTNGLALRLLFSQVVSEEQTWRTLFQSWSSSKIWILCACVLLCQSCFYRSFVFMYVVPI